MLRRYCEVDGSLDWENSYPDVIANGAVAPPDSLAAVKGQVYSSPASALPILPVVLNSHTADSSPGGCGELHSCSCRACVKLVAAMAIKCLQHFHTCVSVLWAAALHWHRPKERDAQHWVLCCKLR